MLVTLLPLALAFFPQRGPNADQLDPISEPLTVVAHQVEGQTWWTLHARHASLKRVLTELGHKSGSRLEGVDLDSYPAQVTVHLERRPLGVVLEYVLGSVNLRAQMTRGTITILTGPETIEDRPTLLLNAAASWVRASSRYPGSASIPSALLGQGELSELRGNPTAASAYYQKLIEDHAGSPNVAEAYMRSGRIFRRMDSWPEASLNFRKLATLPGASDYHAVARLELARCQIAQGLPQVARYGLKTLDTEFPTADPTALTARRLVHAEALIGLDRPLEALRMIESADSSLSPLVQLDAIRLRAMALEGVGRPGDAARAWMIYARDAVDGDRAHAVVQAGTLALAAGDEVGALFVAREAAEMGLTEEVEELRLKARRQLGLRELEEGERTDEERTASGEKWLDQGRFDEARTVFQSLFTLRGAQDPTLRARIAVGWARCLEPVQGIDMALELLIQERAAAGNEEAIGVLDIGAAKLFERNNRWDDAIDAYSGAYAKRPGAAR